MNRLVLAAFAAAALVGCSPASPQVNKDDPFKTLYPWNHQAKGLQKTEHGVEYVMIAKGADPKGPHAKPTDNVEVTYDGRLAATGVQFDATPPGETAKFQLNRVIPGWTEGLQKMQPGDKVMFWIPSAQGYGPSGAGGKIPPNADLMFAVELKAIVPALTADPEAWKKASPWPTNSPEVKRTASGLEYFVITSGKGDKPPPGDHDYAVVQFEGHLEDGSVAATTFDDQQPQIFPIDQLVPGWAQTLKLMHPGDHWMVRIPSSLMYADKGDGRIPPGASVTFEIIMVDVVQVQQPPAGAAGAKSAAPAKSDAAKGKAGKP